MDLATLFKKGFRFIFDKDYRFVENSAYGFYNSWPDEKYLKTKFKCIMGYELNLDNPITYNEKIQWLKLYDRKPEYSMMVDKYRVREYIAEKIGKEYLIPLLGVWNSPNDINFDELPNEFVLKCNHNSGRGVCICKDKAKLNIQKVKKELDKALKQDYYLFNREWPYKDVPRKIICEKYMTDSSGFELKDYKLYAFDGIVQALMVISGRNTGCTCANYYDANFKQLDFTWGYPKIPNEIKIPESFGQMKAFAEILSKGLPEVRIDFYDINGQLYFGEITFFDGSGFEKFNPKEWDKKFGEWITLPNKKNIG